MPPDPLSGPCAYANAKYQAPLKYLLYSFCPPKIHFLKATLVSLSPDISISYSLIPVRNDFQQTVYMTSEDAWALEVCVVVYEGAVSTSTDITETAEAGTAVCKATNTSA